MSVADHQSRNIPIQSGGIVPKYELAPTCILSKRISKKKIEELAILKYRTCGKGIDFTDVMKFRCSKSKAQRILKDCCRKRIGRDGSLNPPSLFRSPKRTSPQRYYPSVLKADIFEKLKQRGNVPIQLTERISSNAPLSNLELQKDCSKYNKAKQHEERSGTAGIRYLVYPNGKVMVFVACNNNPFKLEDEADESILYSFLGQVRDRLLYLVTDPHERVVPPIIKWVLTGCDINKDITVNDMLQLRQTSIKLT